MAAIVVTVMYLYRGYTQENNIIVVNTFEVTILFQFLHLIFLNLHAMFGQWYHNQLQRKKYNM